MTDLKDERTREAPKKTENQKNKKDFVFKGKTPDMQGNVFQVHGEPRKRGEFKRTMDALERYVGMYYSLDTVLLQPLFKDLSEPKITPPKTPSEKREEAMGVKTEADEAPSEWEKIIYMEETKMFLKNKERLQVTLVALYNVVWGQCSRKMKDRLMAKKKYEKVKATNDVKELLVLVKIISNQFQVGMKVTESLMNAKQKLLSYRQGDLDTNAVHVKNIKDLYEVVEYYGGAGMFEDESLIAGEQVR